MHNALVPRRGWQRLLFVATALVAVSPFGSACTVDWTLRDAPFDGDAATTVDAPVGDAVVADAGEDRVVSPVDGGDGGVDCQNLLAEVNTKAKVARACALAMNQCQETLKNHCGCDVVVAEPGNQAAIDFTAAVDAFKNSGCPLGCSASCPTIGPSRNCLAQAGKYECYP